MFTLRQVNEMSEEKTKCDYCGDDAVYQDRIYGPTMVRCCENCQSSAAWDLWDASKEEVDE